METFDLELLLDTPVGKLTGVFMRYPINCYKDIYVAYFKEMPKIVVQSNSLHEAIDELYISLDAIERYKKRKNEKEK